MILLLILITFLIMFLGAPLFTVFSGLTLFLLFFANIDSSAMIIEMHRIATTPILVAIPLFTFAGYLLSESKAPRRLIGLTRRLPGLVAGRFIYHRPDHLLRLYCPDRCYGSYHHCLGGHPSPCIVTREVSGKVLSRVGDQFRDIRPSLSAEPAHHHLCDCVQGAD